MSARLSAFALAGLGWWTLLEYLLHRFLFHGPSTATGRRHLAHHARPRDRKLATAPLASSVGGLAIHGLFACLLFGLASGLSFVAGVGAGYVFYEWSHYRFHFGKPRSARGQRLRRHHMLHHYADAGSRFGVTSVFWDRVFGTLGEPRVTSPRPPPGGG